jgi:hypothetical protein
MESVTEGRGLFEREGWSAGKQGVRNLVFHRSSGPDKEVTYHLSWLGNDGTFETAATITLPRNKDVTLPVGVAPRTDGVHSAILRLSSEKGGPPVHQVATTVVAAHNIPAEKGNKLAITGETEWLRSSAIFFRVPEKIRSLTIEVTLEQGDGVWLTLCDPSRRAPAGDQSIEKGKLRIVVKSASPGVWELDLQNGKMNRDRDLQDRPQVSAKYTLMVSATP